MSSNPLWISEREVVSLLDLPAAIDALEAGLRAEAAGTVENMIKTHVGWDGGATLHAIGAAYPSAGFVGTKTWAHTAGGATPLLILFDSRNGGLRAIIEAFAMGQLRTGGMSGLATRWLSRDTATEFAILGTGKQAITQVASVLAVRSIQRVRVFGRNPERRRAFAQQVRETFEVEVREATSCREAAAGADVVTVATRATEPILTADMVESTAHVNSIGAIVPSRAELSLDLLSRADRIVVDSKPQVKKLSRELIDYCESGGAWDEVEPLSAIIASSWKRSPQTGVTVFKSMGMGISDLSVGIQVYQNAVRRGAGRVLDNPQKVMPPLSTLRGFENQRG